MENCELSETEVNLQACKEKERTISVHVENRIFKVCPVLLATHSSLFEKTFRKNPDLKQIKINEVSFDGFNAVMRFMKRKKFPSENIDMLKVFEAAGKLDILILKAYAEEKLAQQIDESNVYEVAMISNKYHSAELKNAAFAVIQVMFPSKQLGVELMNQPERIEQLLMTERKVNNILKKAQRRLES